MPEIAVEHLTKRFGKVVAVDDLSFEVDKGRIVGFLGPNGAGKTTTLRILLGLVAPTSGTAMIAGRPYAESPDPARQVGAVLEASGFHPGRTASRHLQAVVAAAGLPRTAVAGTLALVGLSDVAGRRVGRYSLGMRQRLALAAALLGRPSVLVLDEPANGLDPESVHWLRELLRAFARDGGTVLLSSHVLAEMAQLVDEVVIIAKGRLVTQSPLAALTRRGVAAVRVRTPQAPALLEALAARGLPGEADGSDQVIVRGLPPERVGHVAAEAGVVIYEMGTERADLEQVFLELTADAGAR
ncbi:MAG: ABC transporter ATP-binding protein [Acidimicrobiales bacterium]